MSNKKEKIKTEYCRDAITPLCFRSQQEAEAYEDTTVILGPVYKRVYNPRTNKYWKEEIDSP